MVDSAVLFHNVSFKLTQSGVKFSQLNLAFEGLKYGIVGDNGVGKTTLLRLITGELSPEGGVIQTPASLAYLPQSHEAVSPRATVLEVLGVAPILQALARIQAGGCDEADFARVDQHWDIESCYQRVLRDLGCWPLPVDQLFYALSGGQKTKLLLAKQMIFPAACVLLDEPTNNLDRETRQVLYHWIVSLNKTVMVVSHDRTLLNQMDCIVALTAIGVQIYGGNYAFYEEQKIREQQALDKDYHEAQAARVKAQSQQQRAREQHEKLASRGRKAFRQGKIDKLTAGCKKARSEKTRSKLVTQSQRILQQHSQALRELQARREIVKPLAVSFDATAVASSKRVLTMERVCFAYSNDEPMLIQDFNFIMTGPARVALIGNNGAGKSTLIKLIRGQLQPLQGSIEVGVQSMAYLDQEVSCLDHDLSVLENYMRLNPELTEFDAYSALARFNFRHHAAKKCVKQLSGGEKVRAALAICLMSTRPPQLILLDEPTNHLDIRSVQAIEAALNAYQGAIIAVSHDREFLQHCAIDQFVDRGGVQHDSTA